MCRGSLIAGAQILFQEEEGKGLACKHWKLAMSNKVGLGKTFAYLKSGGGKRRDKILTGNVCMSGVQNEEREKRNLSLRKREGRAGEFYSADFSLHRNSYMWSQKAELVRTSAALGFGPCLISGWEGSSQPVSDVSPLYWAGLLLPSHPPTATHQIWMASSTPLRIGVSSFGPNARDNMRVPPSHPLEANKMERNSVGFLKKCNMYLMNIGWVH